MRKYLNLRHIICQGLIFAFFFNSLGPVPTAKAEPIYRVEGEFHLPAPGILVHLSPEFNPPILKGIKVHPENPFKFDFILDRGDDYNRHPQQERLKQESTKLIKYFLASLTIPEKDLWVNLSPYEKNRIVPQSFGLTEMGRDLLAEDYMLKQITASLIYPEGEVGKKFWKRIYEEAVKKFGTTNIPVNTFNKVWIVPEKAVVYENAKAGTAYIIEAKLKVMLEEDYLAMAKNGGRAGDMALAVSPSTLPNELGLNVKAPQGNNLSTRESTNALGSQIVREIVIPELTKEVNQDKNFTQLRQVYNSLILATWYKKKIRDSILAQVYENKNKVVGVKYENSVILSEAKDLNRINSLRDSSPSVQNDTELIYQRYLQAFKKGAFNYIKEELNPMAQASQSNEEGLFPRKYFSGGVIFGNPLNLAETQAMPTGRPIGLEKLTIDLDAAMLIESQNDLVEAKEAIGRMMLEHDAITGFDQTIGLARALKEAQISIGLGTSSPYTDIVLGKLGLGAKGFFDAVVDGNIIPEDRRKPEPDTYEVAAKQMGKAVQNLIVFEDSGPGVEAAVKAKIGLVIQVIKNEFGRLRFKAVNVQGPDVVKFLNEDEIGALTVEKLKVMFDKQTGNKLQGVIFDMDGTIADTEKINYEAWRIVFDFYVGQQGNQDFTEGFYDEHYAGLSTKDIIKKFLELHSIQDLLLGDKATAKTRSPALVKLMIKQNTQAADKILGIKDLERTGFSRERLESLGKTPIPNPETVAEHTWAVAYLALSYAPTGMDKADLQRALEMALIHDVPESVSGDMDPTDTTIPAEDKLALEYDAFKTLFQGHDRYPYLLGLFDEYNKGETRAARLAKAADKFDVYLQTRYYQGQRPDIDFSGYIQYARRKLSEYTQPDDPMAQLANHAINDPQIRGLLDIYRRVKFNNRAGDGLIGPYSLASQSWQDALLFLLAKDKSEGQSISNLILAPLENIARDTAMITSEQLHEIFLKSRRKGTHSFDSSSPDHLHILIPWEWDDYQGILALNSLWSQIRGRRVRTDTQQIDLEFDRPSWRYIQRLMAFVREDINCEVVERKPFVSLTLKERTADNYSKQTKLYQFAQIIIHFVFGLRLTTNTFALSRILRVRLSEEGVVFSQNQVRTIEDEILKDLAYFRKRILDKDKSNDASQILKISFAYHFLPHRSIFNKDTSFLAALQKYLIVNNLRVIDVKSRYDEKNRKTIADIVITTRRSELRGLSIVLIEFFAKLIQDLAYHGENGNGDQALIAQKGKMAGSRAMQSQEKSVENGGIDLTSDKALTVQNNGQGIKFHIDQAQLQQLQNAPGFVPVIINMEPMTDLKGFLSGATHGV